MITPTPLTPELLLANLKANPHPKQTHLEMAGGFAYITIDTHKIAYDGERWFACGQQITPRFSMNSLHQEIYRVFVLARKIKERCVGPDLPTEQTFVSTDRYQELEAELARVTVERDDDIKNNRLCTARINDLETQINKLNDQTTDLLAERERLFAQIKTLTEERDESQKRITSIKGELSDACAQLDDAGKSIDRLVGECDRLKSKAESAGLLSVVCRRLCGDEKASIETVHKALDLFDAQRNTLDYIGEKVYCDTDPDAPHRLQAIGRLAAQMSKSLSEKTVEVSKLQEGLTNYKAQVEGLTKRVEQLAFERDAERVGNKWKAETIEDLQRTTVKLPNELTLRRLFNRHNTPDKYREGTPIPTMERLLMLIESLESQVSVQTRRAEHMALVNCHHEAMISDTHAILDEHGVQSYAGDTYLGIPARLRQLFATHTKV